MNRTGRGMMHRLGVRVAALAAAAVLAVFGVFAAGVSVSATETSGSGSITITNPQDGVTYSAYKIFDASYGTKTVDGETQTIVAYTASEAVEAFFTGNSVTGTNPFVFTKNSAGTYNVSIGTNSETGKKYSNTYITQFLAANVTSKDASGVFTKVTTSSTTTNSDGTITISGLEEGYYFVATTSGAVVAITSLNASASIKDKTVPDSTTTDEGGGDDDDNDDDDDPDPTPTTTTTDGSDEEGGSVLGALRDLVDSLTGGGEEGGSVLGAERLPQTGQLNWPIPVLAASGVILVCIGLVIERKERRYEER